MNGLNGMNARVLGVSRDNVRATQKRINGALLLAMNDPQLARDAHADGTITVYRQSGDAPEDDPLRFSAADFMRERLKNAAGADYCHSYNELDPSPLLHTRTKEGMLLAEAAHQKAMIYNLATNKSRSQWESCLDNIRYGVSKGHGISVHFYPDNIHDAGGMEWLDIKRAVGGFWCFTEFGYLRDISKSATQGWRGSPLDKAAFIRKWTQFFSDEDMPAAWFCYDFWDQPTVEKAKSDGLGYNDLPDVLDTFASLSKVFTWSGIVKLPDLPAYPDPSTRGAPRPGVITKTVAATANIRSTPSAEIANVVGSVKVGDSVMYRPIPFANEGRLWSFLESPVRGWISSVATIGDTPVPVDTPLVSLTVPYVPQVSGTANHYRNDCGCACVEMLLRFRYVEVGLFDPLLMTVDELAAKTSLPIKDNGLTSDQLVTLLRGYGVACQKVVLLTTNMVRQMLKAGTPVICLLNYGWFNPADSFKGGHFAVAIGYGANGVYWNDPYVGGENFYTPDAALDKALSDVSAFASVPNQGVILTS